MSAIRWGCVICKCASGRCACALDWFMCLMLIKHFPVNIVGFVWFSVKCQLFNWSWWVLWILVYYFTSKAVHYIWQIALLRCAMFGTVWKCHNIHNMSFQISMKLLHFCHFRWLHLVCIFHRYLLLMGVHRLRSTYVFCRHNLCIWNHVENA